MSRLEHFNAVHDADNTFFYVPGVRIFPYTVLTKQTNHFSRLHKVASIPFHIRYRLAHSTNSGDIYSKQTTVTLTDCWSHDNNDDGYSDHERSETTIIGGLYEYNGKAGITPSFGSHCTCYNVCSRNNNNGFYYIGTVETAEGGKYGQLYCSNCCAENNSSSGFRVDGTGNSAILFNCQSFNNYYGYQASSSSHGILLSNCRTADCEVTKSGNISVRHTEEIIDN